MELTAAVPIMEAAQELNTTHLKLLMLVKQGGLKGEMVDGEWFIERDSLECCKVHGADIKVESGCATYCKASSCGCK